jgi:RNA polymerase sigma-70 factor (ECF subfamily)
MTGHLEPNGASPNGGSLERYRGYLLLLARARVRSLPGNVDASDIVQGVLLKAHACREQFRGQSEGEWRAWLRRILANAVTDAARDGAHEPIVLRALEQSSMRLEAWLAADQTSPSGTAERDERLLLLADALTRLADDERIALEMRYLQEPPASLSEIAQRLERPTPKAVAGLLARALEKLRSILHESP